jgi:NCAIR mutase (PurE)-related protein
MRKILNELLEGKISVEKTENMLKVNNIREIQEIANFDLSRDCRTGFPEAVLADGKEYNDLLLILKTFITEDDNQKNKIIVTKLKENIWKNLEKDINKDKKEGKISLDYNNKAKILIIRKNHEKEQKESKYKIGIITAGTSDIPIAEEARIIAEEGGCEVIKSYDVGIAGIHRLFPKIAEMIENNVKAIIVCAGMEGALPSVVAGLVDIPVIGVPTSVGYGIGGKGKSALYSMLQSCAPGLSVVNIDNGFGGAIFALTIIKTISE